MCVTVGERLNVHGTKIMAKAQSVATGTAHKLKLGESASGAAYMAHNVINDHLRI
jgi:hypothetical protein